MDIIPGRENSQPQVEKTERSAKTETEEKFIERPSFRRQSDPNRHVKSKKNKFKLATYIAGAIIALVIIALAFLFFNQSNTGATIEGDKYQAVFFTNGQVYFGKLHPLNNDYMKLTNIFYLQAKATDSSNPQATSTSSSSDVQLIKLGNEIHGPEDAMIVSKAQVLFFENIKNDSKVTTSIVKYLNTKK